jgi:hypothetical protein
MTNDQILECYTFVHLCNTTAYGTDVKDQLDGRLVGLQNLPSALELPDETWELVVRRNYVTELIRELTSKFPDSVCLEYDPTKPSAAEIEQFGQYDIAKKWKEFTFLDRAQYMKEDAWDTAAKYYTLRAEDIISPRSDSCLLPNQHPAMDSQMGDSLQTGISSLQIQILNILSTPHAVDIYSIQLILTQDIFREPDTLAGLLLGRWSPWLDDIWKSLPSNSNAESHSYNLDMTMEIIQHINPELPDLPIWNPQWTPPDSYLTTEQTAGTIDVAVSSPFYIIPFVEFRKVRCGYYSEAVEDVCNGFAKACRELRRLFARQPERRKVYEDVKLVIPTINRIDEV